MCQLFALNVFGLNGPAILRGFSVILAPDENCITYLLSPLKCSGIGLLHLKLFNAIQV